MDYAGIKHVTIDGDDKEQDRVAKISRFNSGEVNVLVTTLIPKPDILGVSTLHLVEGVEESLFEKLIRKFLRWNLAQNVRVLSVYFYVGYEYNTNDETTDAELYRQVHFKYNTLVQAYDEIVRGAVQVKYSPKHGLVV
jgi:superfamily II DNA/RNA helicase